MQLVSPLPSPLLLSAPSRVSGQALEGMPELKIRWEAHCFARAPAVGSLGVKQGHTQWGHKHGGLVPFLSCCAVLSQCSVDRLAGLGRRGLWVSLQGTAPLQKATQLERSAFLQGLVQISILFSWLLPFLSNEASLDLWARKTPWFWVGTGSRCAMKWE